MPLTSTPSATTECQLLAQHLAESRAALADLDRHLSELSGWAAHLACVLGTGGRLLVAGNGGSAAQASHLTAELVGRFRCERPAYAAIALHAEAAALSALGNDYGFEASFARQVAAHGRAGDVLLALSTSGRSPNVLRAVDEARGRAMTCWALTGPAPNELAELADRAVCVAAASTAAIQEAHQVAVHLLCVGFDEAVREVPA